jgi:aminoglycoside phosphotransferase (APT) family kinase protein
VQPLQPEQSRRGDWRFLLPTSSAAPHDVVAARDPHPDQFEGFRASLQPGGACYLEWRSRLRPSARSLQHRLEAAGFVDVRPYWSWPGDTPSTWIPLDVPSAARWVIRRRRGRRLVYGVWVVLSALGLLRPRCVTAVRPPAAERRGPLGVPLGELDSEPVWALLAPGTDPLNKVLAFVGTGSSAGPAFVLKMPRTEASAAALEREASSLRAISATSAPPAGIPRLLFSHREGAELRAIAETPLEGTPLFEVLDRTRYPPLARRATEWLVELGKAGTSTAERVETPAHVAADAAAAAAPAQQELLLEAGRMAARCEQLPVVFEQRDFSPWNVHIGTESDFVVYDWESAEPAGFPALDLVYLLAYCEFFLDDALAHERARESYARTFGGSVANECLAHYCRALSIEEDLVPPLRTLTWLVHARSALRRNPSGTSAALFLDLLGEEVSGGGADRGAQ